MKFTWKIENFSDLEDGKLQSPPFSTWELIIQQTYKQSNFGSDSGVYIAVELHSLIPISSYDRKNWSVALLDCEGLPLVWQDGQMSSHLVYLIKRIDIFGSRKPEFLQNNILTVQCRIWKTDDEFRRPLSIFAQSRIELAKVVTTLEWHISEANLFREGYSLERVEPILNEEFLTIKLTRLLSERNGVKFEFKVSMFKCKMEVKIMVLDATKLKKILISNHEHNFTVKEEKFTFEIPISTNMIKAHRNQFLSDNTLTLHFICSFSKNVTLNRIVDENEILNIQRPITTSNQIPGTSTPTDKPEIEQPTTLDPPNTIFQALQELLQEGVLSDFNFRVGDRVFPVHKAILTVRSQVFRAMFTTEMKEKENNSVDIQDVDEDTFRRLLQFVYSDKFADDMGWEKASALYAAADKYDLDPLKKGCSTILKSGLCISSVLEVLSLADMHQDQDLKSAALDFILLNDKKVFGSELWVKFEEEHGKLAYETFRNLYFKKMNG